MLIRLFFLLLFVSLNSNVIVVYNGDNYSKKDIENAVKKQKSSEDIIFSLNQYVFENIEVVQKDDNFYVYLQDADYINDVEFQINFQDMNLIKSVKYKKNSLLLRKLFYNTYLNNIFFVNEDCNNRNIVDKNRVAESVDKLKLYFICAGYKDVSVGYDISIKNGRKIITYYITLGKVKNISLIFHEKDIEINKKLKINIPNSTFSLIGFYEDFTFLNYPLEFNKVILITKIYKDIGYLDIKVDLYLDEDNLFHLFFNKGEKYELIYDESLIKYKNIESLDEKTLQKIQKIISMNIFNDDKKKKIKKVISNYYNKFYSTNYYNIKLIEVLNNKEQRFKIIISKNNFCVKSISAIEINGLSFVKESTVLYFLSKKRGDIVNFGEINDIEKSIASLFKEVKVNLISKGETYLLKIDVKELEMSDSVKINGTSSQDSVAPKVHLNYDIPFGLPISGELGVDFSKLFINFKCNGKFYDGLVYGVGLELEKNYITATLFYDVISLRGIIPIRKDQKKQYTLRFNFDSFRFMNLNFNPLFAILFENMQKTGVELRLLISKLVYLVYNCRLYTDYLFQYTYKGSVFADSHCNSHYFSMLDSGSVDFICNMDTLVHNLKSTINIALIFDLNLHLRVIINSLLGIIKNRNGVYYDVANLVIIELSLKTLLKDIIPFPLVIKVFNKQSFINSKIENKNKNGWGITIGMSNV